MSVLKKEFKKQDYNKVDKKGRHIKHTTISESAAKYLATEQWGKEEYEARDQRNTIGKRCA